MKDDDGEAGPSEPASPACLLHELGPDGTPRVDPQQARDVARWRKVERERLIAARMALPAEYRAAQTLGITRDLVQLVPAGPASCVGVYFPIRAEPDLRPWMRALCEQGATVALPLVVAHGQPLVFRIWHPGARLAHGVWNIPYPADGAAVVPNVVIAPVVGFDGACYRLGYGGGFFDRTLAAASPRPLAIGVGYPFAALATIFPQPHDVPMDWLVTGAGPPMRRG